MPTEDIWTIHEAIAQYPRAKFRRNYDADSAVRQLKTIRHPLIIHLLEHIPIISSGILILVKSPRFPDGKGG